MIAHHINHDISRCYWTFLNVLTICLQCAHDPHPPVYWTAPRYSWYLYHMNHDIFRNILSNYRQLPVVESTDRTTGTYYTCTWDRTSGFWDSIQAKRMDLDKCRWFRGHTHMVREWFKICGHCFLSQMWLRHLKAFPWNLTSCPVPLTQLAKSIWIKGRTRSNCLQFPLSKFLRYLIDWTGIWGFSELTW